jgi:hypothetical protein
MSNHTTTLAQHATDELCYCCDQIRVDHLWINGHLRPVCDDCNQDIQFMMLEEDSRLEMPHEESR